MTLEDLLARYEIVRQELVDARNRDYQKFVDMGFPEEALEAYQQITDKWAGMEPDRAASFWDLDQKFTIIIVAYHAKLYLIARDEGLDRAMLWKLQNGGNL